MAARQDREARVLVSNGLASHRAHLLPDGQHQGLQRLFGRRLQRSVGHLPGLDVEQSPGVDDDRRVRRRRQGGTARHERPSALLHGACLLVGLGEEVAGPPYAHGAHTGPLPITLERDRVLQSPGQR